MTKHFKLDNKMRIAQVTATFPPYMGGGGNVCYHNALGLARLGHEVHVFTSAYMNGHNKEEVEKIPVHRLRPLFKVGNASFLPQLPIFLKGFDVIHLHYPFFGGESASLASYLYTTPFVITYHQDVILSGWMGLIEKFMRHTIGYITMRAAHKLLFTTLDYGGVSYARKMLKGREDAIGELPNGVDLTRFSPSEAPDLLEKRFKLSSKDQVVLMVAALDQAHYFKGVPVLLKSLAILPSHIKGIVIGEGDLRKVYEAQATELGIGNRIFFTGRVSDRDLPDFYRLADVTVLPSVSMGEAFGLVLLEAMACEKPVIASNLPGVRAVVNNGKDGLLVEPDNPEALADSLLTILNDDNLRQAMGRSGRAKVEASYSWDQIGVKLENIYRQVLNGH
jgi:glycosyltransferase involved in cell wall biosynthesis